jgi:type II secretory pathway pseudopilin PulG
MKKFLGASAIVASLVLGGVAANALDSKKTTVADSAQAAVEAARRAQEMVNTAVPKGAVLAFNLPVCPTGWKELTSANGRVIVGAGGGNRDVNDKTLTARTVGDVGGEELHVLTIAEMPSHNHNNEGYQYLLTANGQWTAKFGDDSQNEPNLAHMAPLVASGGGQAHNNMQPFVVLKYCERDF